MRILDSQELQTVSGGDCYCCCWRNPPIEKYETLRIGKYGNASECERRSLKSPRCSGYEGCYEDSSHCSNIGSITLLTELYQLWPPIAGDSFVADVFSLDF